MSACHVSPVLAEAYLYTGTDLIEFRNFTCLIFQGGGRLPVLETMQTVLFPEESIANSYNMKATHGSGTLNESVAKLYTPVADPGGGGSRGSGPPLLGHNVGFLTLGTKLDPPRPLECR